MCHLKFTINDHRNFSCQLFDTTKHYVRERSFTSIFSENGHTLIKITSDGNRTSFLRQFTL
jgi:hypothetical protein